MQQALAIDTYGIFDHIAQISNNASDSLSKSQKEANGAYYTPKALSEHMISVADYNGGKLGDKGAGAGVLSAMAIAKHLLSDNKTPCFVSAYEKLPEIQPYLERCYEVVSQQAKACRKQFDYTIGGDFLSVAEDAFSNPGDYDNIIINPPYFKIKSKCEVNNLIFQKLGFRLPNIYSVFILLSLLLLKNGASLTALVPRSFFNGAYHKPFRRYLKKYYSIDTITRYRSRSNAFKEDNVLQENVIIKITKRPQVPQIAVFTYECPNSPSSISMILPASLLLENESDVIVLPADQDELIAYQKVRSLPKKLCDLGLSLSTGKVIPSRNKGFLNNDSEGAMFIEAKCLDTEYPTYKAKASPRAKGNALIVHSSTQSNLIPAQTVVLIKRISSNSDNKRMHCTVLRQQDCTTEQVAIADSIQYLYGKDFSDDKASKISGYLTSRDVELTMRAINGTTQIYKEDIAMLRFPTFE